MNSIDKVIKLPYSSDELQYTLSTLHAWIRFFECLIHISYKIPIKKWQLRGDAALVKEQKINIQKGFQQKMGLIVNYPKSGGSGTLNDGNTARKAFSIEDAFAEITGINKELIVKLHIILICISSGFEINISKFCSFCLETAKLYSCLYHWYYMPFCLYKILIHGAEVIESLSLPIGLLSEEAQEAKIKILKIYSEHHSR